MELITGSCLVVHTFSVRFVDGPLVDPTPATFTWDIIPDTIIDSAIDGDGNELIDDVAPTTTSDSIDFTFSAELDGAPTTVEGFTCELDETGPKIVQLVQYSLLVYLLGHIPLPYSLLLVT